MKKVAVLFALLGTSAFAADITGFIADSKCGAKHANASDASAACAQKCIKGGADAVLVTKDAKVYKIAADSQDKAKEFAGKTVTVDGSVKGGTLTINSIQ